MFTVTRTHANMTYTYTNTYNMWSAKPCATKTTSNNRTLDVEDRNTTNYQHNNPKRETYYNEARWAQQTHYREERLATATI